MDNIATAKWFCKMLMPHSFTDMVLGAKHKVPAGKAAPHGSQEQGKYPLPLQDDRRAEITQMDPVFFTAAYICCTIRRAKSNAVMYRYLISIAYFFDPNRRLTISLCEQLLHFNFSPRQFAP